MTATMPSSNGNLFSSLTSLFGGATLGGAGPSSSSGYMDRKNAANLNNGALPTSVRHGPPRSMSDDDGAWRMPYNRYSGAQAAADAHSGIYPPSSNNLAARGYPQNDTSATPNESTSTLVPGAAQSRHSLSLATNVSIPSTAYPPLKHTWRRIRSWCDNNYSELADTLNWPAAEAQLDDLELTIGYSLPSAVRDSYMCYDGQELESNQSCNDGLFFGLPLLSVDQIADEWRFWRNVDEDPTTGANPEVKGWMCSCPAGWVRSEYSCRGWIPLISDRMGNYIGVDLSPNPSGGGSPGQVILFGRDFDTKIVLWRGEGEGGWGRFLQYIAEELESGEMWTLEDTISSDSNDEEDGIGYESYFSGGGSGAGRGGGDRGGDGGAGFKLRGEYKGWPVFEAWADRSMRCWDEIGMPSSQPAWKADHPTPSVVLEEVQGADHQEDEGEASFDAEGSNSASAIRDHIITEHAGPSSSIANASHDYARSTGQAHPLEAQSSAPGTPTLDTASYRPSDSLSPPPRHSYGNKQKQREDAGGVVDSARQQPRRRPPPPAPAAPLDLPTIDDVRAAHAAAVASQQRGGNYHYDVERATRPPPGMGGMGMGMGMSSDSASYYVQRYPSATSRREGSGSDGRPFYRTRDETGVELDTRSSSEALYAGQRESDLSDSRRASLANAGGSPRVSINDVPSPSHLNAGRTLYTASRSTEAVDSLIDASSSPDVSIQIEGTKAAANAHPSPLSNPPKTNTMPAISSPLATQESVFSSAQSAARHDLKGNSDSAQPLAV